MQDNEQVDENVLFDAEPQPIENKADEEEKEEWENEQNRNAINEGQNYDALGDYELVCEDDVDDFIPQQNKQEIFVYYRNASKSWFRDEKMVRTLNEAIANRKRALKDGLKDKPAEFGKEIIRYCINKRAYLFLRAISGGDNQYFMRLIDNVYEQCHLTKISEIYINGQQYHDFYFSKRNRNKEHIEFTLKEVNEIRIWSFVPIEAQNQQQQESPYEVILQLLASYIKTNLFPDILQTLGHLLWQKNKNNV